MASQLYVLISWPDGSRVINIENIKEPQKPVHLYSVECQDVLEKKLQKEKHLLKKFKKGPEAFGPLPTDKKSKKSFPNWVPGIPPKKNQGGRILPVDYPSVSAPQNAPAASHITSPLTEERVIPEPPVIHHAITPQSPLVSAFSFPASFLDQDEAGTSQKEEADPQLKNETETRGCVTLALKRKADGIVVQCQEHVPRARVFYSLSCDDPKSKSAPEMNEFDSCQKSFRTCEMEREKIGQLERLVWDLQREVISLKKKVQKLESASLREEAPGPQFQMVELFNGYTREQLRETIRFDQKVSTACKTLLYKLFTSDYIQSHSITGRRGNTFREAKPMMDERCIKVIRLLLKQKFGDHLSDTVITEKIQNVQKALRQKYKAECL
ncbi:uncharacterized protein LOC103170489 isoform X2 [Ornithorhynchus anatinus]|uniref:uncharacterized protein LOC103170489 isoform X2 n=1 Tax=Ornithorhynchus anatinus TaxID=9258 RepID=UPI0010A8EBAF|nr:uncharacterized protein LOC103170489 isoform X2 [Ornithorhynchus anatinus]